MRSVTDPEALTICMPQRPTENFQDSTITAHGSEREVVRRDLWLPPLDFSGLPALELRKRYAAQKRRPPPCSRGNRSSAQYRLARVERDSPIQNASRPDRVRIVTGSNDLGPRAAVHARLPRQLSPTC